MFNFPRPKGNDQRRNLERQGKRKNMTSKNMCKYNKPSPLVFSKLCLTSEAKIMPLSDAEEIIQLHRRQKRVKRQDGGKVSRLHLNW